MNENEFLNFILSKVAIETSGIAMISVFDLEELGVNDVTPFEKLNLLVSTNQATHLRCYECSETCFAPVTISPQNQFSPETIFMTCKNGMGRTQVESNDLNQWQASARQIAQLVANLFGCSKPPIQKNELWQIGLVEGKHAGMLLLDFHAEDGVECIINEQRVSLIELMRFDGNNFKLDMERFKKMATAGVLNNGKVSHKQELRKQATNSRNDKLYNRYLELKKINENKSDNQIFGLIKKEVLYQNLKDTTIKRVIAEKKRC
jgi:hypothetical protein